MQVISKALDIWGLEMIPYGSTVSIAVDARAAPTQQTGKGHTASVVLLTITVTQ